MAESWSDVGFGALSSLADGLIGIGANAANGAVNLGYSKSMARYNARLSKELARFNADLSREQTEWATENLPALSKAGLLSAGFNPLLAVSSASGEPMSTSVPSSGGSVSGGSNSPASILRSVEDIARIRQTNAQTDYIERRTAGEGWQLKTLTAHEARGLGASIASKLGFHFNGSDSQTFLVAYNPITGELRNVANTRSLGSTGEVTNAADIPEGTVDVIFEPLTINGKTIHDKMRETHFNVPR